MPAELHNRQREVARPLMAVADACGGTWPERIRTALVHLFSPGNGPSVDNTKVELLADIRETFNGTDRLSSKGLAEALAAMEERPWPHWNHGQPINQYQIARLLRDFKLPPTQTIRFTKIKNEKPCECTAKGFYRSWFEPIWERYAEVLDRVSALVTDGKQRKTRSSSGL